jgi:hypothetical protein
MTVVVVSTYESRVIVTLLPYEVQKPARVG